MLLLALMAFGCFVVFLRVQFQCGAIDSDKVLLCDEHEYQNHNSQNFEEYGRVLLAVYLFVFHSVAVEQAIKKLQHCINKTNTGEKGQVISDSAYCFILNLKTCPDTGSESCQKNQHARNGFFMLRLDSAQYSTGIDTKTIVTVISTKTFCIFTVKLEFVTLNSPFYSYSVTYLTYSHSLRSGVSRPYSIRKAPMA